MKYDVYNEKCPSRMALELISDKWVMLIIEKLHERLYRFGELRREIGGISQKMLTQTLRKMILNGLIEREAFAETVARVEYRLSGLGDSLYPLVSGLSSWAKDNIHLVLKARERNFAARNDVSTGSQLSLG